MQRLQRLRPIDQQSSSLGRHRRRTSPRTGGTARMRTVMPAALAIRRMTRTRSRTPSVRLETARLQWSYQPCRVSRAMIRSLSRCPCILVMRCPALTRVAEVVTNQTDQTAAQRALRSGSWRTVQHQMALLSSRTGPRPAALPACSSACRRRCRALTAIRMRQCFMRRYPRVICVPNSVPLREHVGVI